MIGANDGNLYRGILGVTEKDIRFIELQMEA